MFEKTKGSGNPRNLFSCDESRFEGCKCSFRDRAAAGEQQISPLRYEMEEENGQRNGENGLAGDDDFA
jgi:hypothetical protein